ncbi:hypothetical protein BC829DRAFT_424200 [Chytridium lagenaria]|nr:hypothetical protein BC829DRAFT_424200 [Chytridium lagenaria]
MEQENIPPVLPRKRGRPIGSNGTKQRGTKAVKVAGISRSKEHDVRSPIISDSTGSQLPPTPPVNPSTPSMNPYLTRVAPPLQMIDLINRGEDDGTRNTPSDTRVFPLQVTGTASLQPSGTRIPTKVHAATSQLMPAPPSTSMFLQSSDSMALTPAFASSSAQGNGKLSLHFYFISFVHYFSSLSQLSILSILWISGSFESCLSTEIRPPRLAGIKQMCRVGNNNDSAFVMKMAERPVSERLIQLGMMIVHLNEKLDGLQSHMTKDIFDKIRQGFDVEAVYVGYLIEHGIIVRPENEDAQFDPKKMSNEDINLTNMWGYVKSKGNSADWLRAVEIAKDFCKRPTNKSSSSTSDSSRLPAHVSLLPQSEFPALWGTPLPGTNKQAVPMSFWTTGNPIPVDDEPYHSGIFPMSTPTPQNEQTHSPLLTSASSSLSSRSNFASSVNIGRSDRQILAQKLRVLGQGNGKGDERTGTDLVEENEFAHESKCR